MKQRLGIAAALLTEPQLLVLDEPTNGLDPQGIRDMRDLLRSLAADGPTVLVSSHLLGEVQQACDWLVIVEAGRLVHSGPTAALLTGSEAVLAPEDPVDLPRLERLLRERGLEVRTDEGRLLAGPVEASGLLAALNRAACGRGDRRWPSCTGGPRTLEDRYGALLSGSLVAAPPAVTALIRAVRAQLLVLRRPAVLGALLGLLPALAVLADGPGLRHGRRDAVTRVATRRVADPAGPVAGGRHDRRLRGDLLAARACWCSCSSCR